MKPIKIEKNHVERILKAHEPRLNTKNWEPQDFNDWLNGTFLPRLHRADLSIYGIDTNTQRTVIRLRTMIPPGKTLFPVELEIDTIQRPAEEKFLMEDVSAVYERLNIAEPKGKVPQTRAKDFQNLLRRPLNDAQRSKLGPALLKLWELAQSAWLNSRRIGFVSVRKQATFLASGFEDEESKWQPPTKMDAAFIEFIRTELIRVCYDAYSSFTDEELFEVATLQDDDSNTQLQAIYQTFTYVWKLTEPQNLKFSDLKFSENDTP